MVKVRRYGKMWCIQDPEDPSYSIALRRRPVSERKAQIRAEKARDLAEMEADIMADPETAYLYLKQQEDERTARRLMKDPQYWGRGFKSMLRYAQSISGNDDMPTIIRKAPGSETFSAHNTLKTIKQDYRQTAKERREARLIEQNAEAGNYHTKKWDPDFISQVVNIRNRRGLSQKDMALLMNVTEGDIHHFERGELQYNPGLHSQFMWKLGMA